jgi:hypothetical protein
MAKTSLPIVGGSYQMSQLLLGCQRCINLYPHALEVPNGEYTQVLLSTPGLTLYQGLASKVRAMLALANGMLLLVSGANICLLSPMGGAPLTIGLLGGALEDVVNIAENGLQAVIVTPSRGVVVDLASHVVTPITDPAFYGADNVDFLDGRFVFNRPGTGQIYWTDLYNTDFDGLSFATAEGNPDNIRALLVKQLELWLVGDVSTEVYYSTGDKDQPYARQGGAYIPYGIMAPRSLSRFGTSLVWLAKSEFGGCQVVMIQGYQAAPISTMALNVAFAGYARVDDAVGYAYQQSGHSFYVLTFPTAGKTWCYDLATQAWHERAYLGTDGSLERHRGERHCYWQGMHLLSDYASGNLYRIDVDSLTDNGRPIKRQRTAPLVSAKNQRLRIDALELILPTGEVPLSGAGSDPMCVLEWSNDGGVTWSHPRLKSIGKRGEYGKRVIYRRLGVARQRVFRITFSDVAPFSLIAAELTVEEARS